MFSLVFWDGESQIDIHSPHERMLNTCMEWESWPIFKNSLHTAMQWSIMNLDTMNLEQNNVLNNLGHSSYHQALTGWADLMWILPFLLPLSSLSLTIWCSLPRTTKHKWLRISKAYPSNRRAPLCSAFIVNRVIRT